MTKNQDAINKIFKEPVIIEFSDNVKKARRNLMTLSFISLFLTLSGVGIDSSSTFFGLKFNNLNNDLIISGLCIVLIYHLIYFLWFSYDSLQEWAIRTTGINETYRYKDDEDPLKSLMDIITPDLPSDPRNSTLYYWWQTQAQHIGNLKPLLKDSLSQIETLEKTIHNLRDETKLSRDTINISIHVQPLKDTWTEINSAVQVINSTLKSEQISTSLKRFDNRYKLFLYSQNIRWIMIDYLIPVGLGIISTYLTISSLIKFGS